MDAISEFLKNPKHKNYLDKVRKLGFNPEHLVYTRHTMFHGEPCDICGSTKLIMGKGRYVSFDPEREDDTAIFICGDCLNYLEEQGIRTDMT